MLVVFVLLLIVLIVILILMESLQVLIQDWGFVMSDAMNTHTAMVVPH